MLMYIWNYLRNQKGQGMVEYGLIIALVGIALTAALTGMEGGISTLFGKVATKLTTTP